MGQSESFPVCRGCGILARSNQAQCPRCGTATGEHVAWVPFRADGAVSTAIEMEFQCRACGHWASASFLDLDGSLGCAHCGIEQAFPPERFRDVLAGAHDVGDLAGPNAEGHPANRSEPVGTSNPYAAIGNTEDLHATELDRSEQLDLKVKLRLTRGRRLCHGCQMPVEFYPDGHGKVTTVCSYCQDRAEYTLPAGAAALYPPLLGVVADEHRSDCRQSETVTGDAAGPVAIQCPSCHAPLEVSATSAFAKCQYCNTRSVIPARAWARATADKPEPRIWFALLRGPSEGRKRLAMEAAMERASRDETGRSKAAFGGAPPRHRTDGPRPGPRRRLRLVHVLAVVFALLLGVFIYVEVIELQEYQERTDAAAKPSKKGGRKSSKSKKGASKKAAPPGRALFQDLSHCSCLTEINDKPGLENVGVASRVRFDDGGKLQLEIYLDVEKSKSIYLPLGSKTAPPSHPKGPAIAIGIACDRSVVALISGHYATGWSAKTGKRFWTKKIAGSYDHPKPPPPKQGQFSTWCEQLSTTDGHTSLNIGGGKKLRLRLADGRLTTR